MATSAATDPLLPSRSRPLLHDDPPPPPPMLRLPFRYVAAFTLGLPLVAFVFCIAYSYTYNFKRTTATHCGVWNFAPSISSAISVFRPQSYVWRLGLALHSAPRLLLCKLYHAYYRRGLRGRFPRLARAAFLLNLAENLSLLLLSFASSKEDYVLHKTCFIAFIAFSSCYFALSLVIVKRLWWATRTPLEKASVLAKQVIFGVYAAAVVMAVYFFYRHNAHCEPGVYSLFSICEYVVVFANMAYHFTSYLDFHDRVLTL